MGDYDFVKVVLERLAADAARQHVCRGCRSRSSPRSRSRSRRSAVCPVFGLPGNPVSSRVSFELFARPALRQLAGRVRRARRARDRGARPRRCPAGPTGESTSTGSRAVRGRRLRLRPGGSQASNVLSGMAAATGLGVPERRRDGVRPCRPLEPGPEVAGVRSLPASPTRASVTRTVHGSGSYPAADTRVLLAISAPTRRVKGCEYRASLGSARASSVGECNHRSSHASLALQQLQEVARAGGQAAGRLRSWPTCSRAGLVRHCTRGSYDRRLKLVAAPAGS